MLRFFCFKLDFLSATLRTKVKLLIHFAGHPIVNDPLYNHPVFGEERGRAGRFGRPETELVTELCNLHSADNWEDGEFHILQNR
mgnify:CR=1 FL=1